MIHDNPADPEQNIIHTTRNRKANRGAYWTRASEDHVSLPRNKAESYEARQRRGCCSDRNGFLRDRHYRDNDDVCVFCDKQLREVKQ